MKNNMMLPIIIIVIVLVVASLGLFAYNLFKDDGKDNPKKSSQSEELIEPQLKLELDDVNDGKEKVSINAEAYTDDEEGIKAIILPDGTQVDTTTISYEVTENGKYTFKVIGNNGKENSMSIEVQNIREASAEFPYIPEGFEHVGGEPDNGYIIEDKIGNQYVWVPVPNGKMTRNTMLDQDYIESTNTASALVNSVAKNYGFYIARFEASETEVNGAKAAASLPSKTPWTNITYLDAANVALKSASAFEYPDGYSTAIINSYAWDTTLKWIDEGNPNYSTTLNFGNYSGQIYPTGATESDIIYGICDLAGNVREWTTEIFKGATETSSKKGNKNNQEVVLYRVVRGGSASLNKTAGSHIGYPENTSENYWGFRTILYKE